MAGSGDLKGNVKADKLAVTGSCSLGGDVDARVFESSGAVKVTGSVVAQSVEASGMYRVGGGLKAETVEVAGFFDVDGDVEAERFELDGAFRVSGLINADRIEVELDGSRSSAREIGGSRIEVRSRRSFLGWSRKRGHLKAESIEGDDIYLEATAAGSAPWNTRNRWTSALRPRWQTG